MNASSVATVLCTGNQLCAPVLFAPCAGKVGVELVKDAADLLYDGRGSVRMRGGLDVSEALVVKTESGRKYKVRGPPPRALLYALLFSVLFLYPPHSHRLTVGGRWTTLAPLQLGLVRSFNAAFGTSLTKDKAVTCSDWAAPRLSLVQLEYAAFDAFMSWAVAAAEGCALLRHEDLRTISVPSPPTQLLLNVCPMLRECEARRSGSSSKHRHCRLPAGCPCPAHSTALSPPAVSLPYRPSSSSLCSLIARLRAATTQSAGSSPRSLAHHSDPRPTPFYRPRAGLTSWRRQGDRGRLREGRGGRGD